MFYRKPGGVFIRDRVCIKSYTVYVAILVERLFQASHRAYSGKRGEEQTTAVVYRHRGTFPNSLPGNCQFGILSSTTPGSTLANFSDGASYYNLNRSL